MLTVAILLFVSCTGPPETVSQSPATTPAPVTATAARQTPTPTPTPLIFRVTADEARMTATVVAFLDAYNAGRVDAALAYLTPDVAILDCDYRSGKVFNVHTTPGAREWLRNRAGDHDFLVLESIKNENPDMSTGSHVVAVSYAKRTSDTLRSLGYPSGVLPSLGAKIVFNETNDLMRTFMAGIADPCRPT